MIDIGVNLTNKSFASDRDAVIERARAAGVVMMIVTGTSVGASQGALELARSRPGDLRSTAGVHPHEASTWDAAAAAAIRELAAAPEVVALGECGLDFNRDFSPRPDQERAFAEQLGLAAELGLPVFLHERDAHERLVALLAPRRDELVGGVIHCFTGGRNEVRAYLDLDLHVGVTGWICDERRGHELREAVTEIPEERLLVETDAPYLLPRDLRPKPRTRRNEPAWLPHILETVATCRGDVPARLARITEENTRRLFRLGQRDA